MELRGRIKVLRENDALGNEQLDSLFDCLVPKLSWGMSICKRSEGLKTSPAESMWNMAVSIGGAIAQAALSKVGTAYSAMDCSQLTGYAYSQAGVSLPRTSVAQAKYCYDNGYGISQSQLQPGDLVFWSKSCSCLLSPVYWAYYA